MKRIFTSFLVVFVMSFCQNIKAFAYSSDPEKFITEIIDEAKLILNSQDSKETKAEKLSVIALKTVDVKGIGYILWEKRGKKLQRIKWINTIKYLRNTF